MLRTYSSTFFASTSSGTLPPRTRVSLNAFRSNFAPSAVVAFSRWLVPDPAVLDAFYKGNSSFFVRTHLIGWAAPVVAWTGFILALLGAMFCLNVMLRKPWVEHERLTFPLVYLPLELTRTETSRSLLRFAAFSRFVRALRLSAR